MDNWIVTAPEGGRRRAGRRWAEGGTIVPEAEQSEDLWAAINGDRRMGIREARDDDEIGLQASASDDTPVADKPAKIVAAIGGLSQDDFIAAGSPKISALSKAAGFDVSGLDRDRAWAIVEAVREAPEAGLNLALVISTSGIADVSEAEFTVAMTLRK